MLKELASMLCEKDARRLNNTLPWQPEIQNDVVWGSSKAAKENSGIGKLEKEQAYRLCRFAWGEVPFAELQLYNLRHVQEHGAQLRMFLGQQAGKSARWVSRAQ